MLKKGEKILSVFYVIFFAPFCVNFLFPLIQLYLLGKDKNYYSMSEVSTSNLILVVLSVVVSVIALLIGNTGRTHEILYYGAGVIAAVFCKNRYHHFYETSFLDGNLLCGIFALGYLFVVLCIIIGAVSKTGAAKMSDSDYMKY